MQPTLRSSDDGPIRTLTLVNPAKRNALTPSMLSALSSSLPTSPSSPSQPVRVVILQGEGSTFSSGFDLAAIDGERAAGIDPITAGANAIAACPVPVIAAVDGACFGGAVELLAACSLRVASSTTRFAVPAVKLGLVYPVGGLRRLRRVLGAAAERVLLTGLPFSADDARAYGLVHDVVVDARAFAVDLAAAVAAAAPIAVAGTLAALRAVDDGADDTALEALRAASLASDDLAEGIRAANEKRPVKFTGR